MLREGHELHLVRVRARAETCAQRIAARDPSQQIDVARALIDEMHRRSEALQLPWALDLVNDPPLSPAAIAAAFAPLLS